MTAITISLAALYSKISILLQKSLIAKNFHSKISMYTDSLKNNIVIKTMLVS